jgi:PAS domain S-box-containing protein
LKSFLDRKAKLALGIAIATLLLMGVLSYRWMVLSDESGQWTGHSYDVLESAQNLNMAMESVVSASREFMLTGDESELDNYRTGVLNVEREEVRLRGLIADNPTQQAHLLPIEMLIGKQIQRAEILIELRGPQGVAAVSASLNGGDGSLAEQIGRATGQFRDEEVRLRSQRVQATERDLSRTKIILFLGTLLGILIAVLSGRSLLAEGASHRVSEAALQESEEKFRMLMDGVQDYAIFMLDPKGKVSSWSASAERIEGYSPEEIIGRNFSCFFVPEDIKRGRPEEVLRISAASGRHEEFGMRVRKDGSEFLASVTFIAIRDGAGELQGFSEICRDLSEHKESEARYRGLLEAAPDGMVVVNRNGAIVLLNAQAEKQFGYHRDELLGQTVTNIIPKGFAERLIADGTRTAAEALAQQIGTGIELIGKRRDGTDFPIEIMLSPLESSEGILVTAAIRDISVRKDAEKHLAQMEARYRGLLEAAPDGMVVVNPIGEIVLLNAQAEKQFGYHRDELLGQNVKNIIPEGFAERLIADALRTSAEALAQQIGTGIELHGRRKDGTEFPIEIMLSPLESAEGILITAAIRDISERKQLARQLHQSQKMEAVGQLTGGIAHDFNNLLTVIIGNLGLLQRLVADNGPAIKRVNTAQKAAARGADITRRLLVFSSNEELMPAIVTLEDSVHNMIEMAARGLGAAIKVTTQLDSAVPPLFVDPAGLESALLNLVVNARDAMPNGGSIIVSSRLRMLDKDYPAVQSGDLKEGHYVNIGVTDTGQGMSRATLERACEPFFTTKRNNHGTGLGLAMVYGFAKQSGGMVRIYSELGHGTTVSLYLPVVGDLLRPAPANQPRPLNARLGGTVLVVDDEPDLLEVALIYLEEMGFTAIQARDGINALEIIALHDGIDLMITDIVMPGGMNGTELVQRARAICPGLKAIYSSGFPAEALAERIMPLIDGPLLRKPYQRAEFTAIVELVMEEGNPILPQLEGSHSAA